MTRLATCACGQLRVTCHGEPATVALCHCLDCQKRTGSTYGIAAFFGRADVEPQGEARQYTRPGDSGSSVLFHFCPNCGSSVYWEPARMPHLIAIAVGAFADPDFPAPSVAVYKQRRHGWVADI
ncbi:aldehyde-activating protein [Bradyrhizobium sp. UFLA03-84]|uniref:GFA family protein n=1 Tax=Bradyrhizobium sp. UFLA03-84 TaxID=418599 RepID=UPI000BADF725|nr:GFA family protein [Bradyrhizobium sp. UFLA03-84]PAY03602.1 aldehyde-activating protein [Bradyrhizobium sp. UFLA03-84]